MKLLYAAHWVAALLFIPYSLAQAEGLQSNGYWWKTLSKEEQIAYFSGDFDCYVFDIKGSYYSDKNVDIATDNVSKFYDKNNMNTSVSMALRKSGTLHSRPNTGNRHAYYDGEFWRVYLHKERLAFVRGYLECRAEYLHEKIANPFEFYVKKISDHYGISAADWSEDIDEKTENDKIGDVINQTLQLPSTSILDLEINKVSSS